MAKRFEVIPSGVSAWAIVETNDDTVRIIEFGSRDMAIQVCDALEYWDTRYNNKTKDDCQRCSQYDEGYEEGKSDGHDTGYDEGYDAGKEVGYSAGYAAGLAEQLADKNRV